MPFQPTAPADDAARIIVLNQPHAIEVEADSNGLPRVLVQRGQRLKVEAIQDVWRIDDEWWRSTISRRYFLLTLESGIVRTVYQDLVNGAWHEQRY